MRNNPTRPLLRLAARLARLYRDQVRKDNEATLRQQFAALDYGLPPTMTSFVGRGLPGAVSLNPDDPLERLWHLPARKQAEQR